MSADQRENLHDFVHLAGLGQAPSSCAEEARGNDTRVREKGEKIGPEKVNVARFAKDVEVTGRCGRGVGERLEVEKEPVEGAVGEREARAGLEEEFMEERRR